MLKLPNPPFWINDESCSGFMKISNDLLLEFWRGWRSKEGSLIVLDSIKGDLEEACIANLFKKGESNNSINF